MRWRCAAILFLLWLCVPAMAQYANVMPVPFAGTFVDESGHHTYINFVPVQSAGCEQGDFVNMYITKDYQYTYWQFGADGAEIQFILHKDVWQPPLGTGWALRATRSIIKWRTVPADYAAAGWGNAGTLDYVPLNGGAYLYIPVQSWVDATHSLDGSYDPKTGNLNAWESYGQSQWYLNKTQWRPDCQREAYSQGDPLVSAPAPMNYVVWFYWEQVQTSYYSGPAFAVEQFEGCTPQQARALRANPSLNTCAWETWDFAPNVGLVRIKGNGMWDFGKTITLVSKP